jgi:hypothetical protein
VLLIGGRHPGTFFTARSAADTNIGGTIKSGLLKPVIIGLRRFAACPICVFLFHSNEQRAIKRQSRIGQSR